MNDLIEFLNARLAEDERGADTSLRFVAEATRIEALDRRRTRNPVSRWTLDMEARAKRTLAEVAAKRAIIELHALEKHIYRKAPDCGPDLPAWACRVCHWETDDEGRMVPDYHFEQACETLRRMAEVYHDHSDWREEWKA